MWAYVKVTVLLTLEVVKTVVCVEARPTRSPSISSLQGEVVLRGFALSSSFLSSFCYVIAITAVGFSPHSVSRRCVCVCSPFLQLVQDSLKMGN